MKPVSVEVYTASHRILGRISLAGSGLFSFLNIPTTSSLEIEGAHLFRLHQPGRLIARYPTLWLVKEDVFAVLVSSRAEIGPAGLARGGYSTAVSHWVHFLLGVYELQGIIETPGKFNFGFLIFEGDRMFIPMYNGQLTAGLFPSVRGESAAMLFNREKVDAASLLPKKDIPEGPGA
jgi:hypothetical protein